MRLRNIILIALFLFSSLPLFFIISFNLPGVLSRFEIAAHEKQLSLLHEEFLVLSNLMEKRMQSLHVFSVNPGSRELAGSTVEKVPIDVIRKRFGSMMVNWYQGERDVFRIEIADQSGQLQLKIDRHSDGQLRLAPQSELINIRKNSVI